MDSASGPRAGTTGSSSHVAALETPNRRRPSIENVDPQPCVSGKHIEVAVVVKDIHVGANGDCADEAVKEPANGLSLPSAKAIKRRRLIIIRRPSWKDNRTRQQPAQPPEVTFAPRAGEHFHSNRIADGDLALQQFIDSVADRRSGISKEFDPGRRVDQGHFVRPMRNSSRSPAQPDPRRRRASGSPRDSVATVRNAKLTASRFVAKQKRRMTSAQASSSISTLVRGMCKQYTAPQ